MFFMYIRYISLSPLRSIIVSLVAPEERERERERALMDLIREGKEGGDGIKRLDLNDKSARGGGGFGVF